MLRVFACLVVGLASRGQVQPVSVNSLLSEMADSHHVARTPALPFKQLQASSYDRNQTDPKDAKTWFANKDYEQFIRTERRDGRTEWVIMEHEGPGAITRIWTPLLADKDKMVVRFYLDGSATPVIEEKFNDFMRGRRRIKPPFAYVAWPDPGVADGVGADMYFPIPFARSCKITLDELPFYYSVDYRAYRAGTPVTTFSWSDVEAAGSAVAATAQALTFAATSGLRNLVSWVGRLDRGKSAIIDAPRGEHEISELDLDVPPTITAQALRSIVLRIDCDGEEVVWCPIGDFFGCGVTLRPVSDRFRQVSQDGHMRSAWPMPYKSKARVALVNLNGEPLRAQLVVKAKSAPWTIDTMHFHATWHHQYPLATRPMSDWNYVSIHGQGVYVGDTLTVMNPSTAWYGEGDERVYQDGEAFPSFLGTGTEDYYGYAWGMDEHWSSPFMSMPLRDRKGRENWLGFTTTSRIRGLDDIPFNQDLRFDMEIWHWADCKVEYSAACFWYAKPGARSNPGPSPADAAATLPEVGGTIKGAVECEAMTVLSKSPDVVVSTQAGALTEGTWSGGEQLFLQAHAKGDFIELRVPNRLKGKRHVQVYATKSFDYGVVQFSVNGKPGKTIDLYGAKPVASGVIDLGEFALDGHDFTLRVDVTGSNPASRGDRYYFGLDCVVLR